MGPGLGVLLFVDEKEEGLKLPEILDGGGRGGREEFPGVFEPGGGGYDMMNWLCDTQRNKLQIEGGVYRCVYVCVCVCVCVCRYVCDGLIPGVNTYLLVSQRLFSKATSAICN